MKKMMLMAVSLMVLGSGALFAEAGMEFCRKGCKASDLRAEIKALEKRQQQAGNTGGKAVEVQREREQVQKHLAMHRAELDMLDKELASANGTAGQGQQAKYRCSMDGATSDKPGKCPKCGMDMERM